ncbi:hypothetical protein BLNAU_14959 [Blattamonas nauphoetae]|uniref:Uncharacterized protein n=1 Tax=Blattamonas nauphoetae TaxID=2049346 RepID=A0ABQ9XHP0_9EUKA|nr:hypothetical protein BLNAU_14959 [Blattamonas nauphoetae]
MPSPPPFASRCPSPPAMVAIINNEAALLQSPTVGRNQFFVSPPPQPLLSFHGSQNHVPMTNFTLSSTPNMACRTQSISPPSQPLLSSVGSSHSAVSSFSTTDPRLNPKATTFVPRRLQQTPTSNPSTSHALPDSAVTIPFLFPNHVTSRSSSPTDHHPQNPSTPIIDDCGNPFDEERKPLFLEDGDSNQFDDDLDTLTLDDVDGEERHLFDDDFTGIAFRGEDSDGSEQMEGESEMKDSEEFDLDQFSPFSSGSNLVGDFRADDLRDNDAFTQTSAHQHVE